MNYWLLIIFSIILLASHVICAQAQKNPSRQLIIELQEQEKELIKCQQNQRKVSLYCSEFCPVKLVKPDYSAVAKSLRITGQVKIEIIVNEDGKVIYAGIIKSQPFLSQAARKAALHSTFQPKRNCDNKPIKFRGTIIYNFFFFS